MEPIVGKTYYYHDEVVDGTITTVVIVENVFPDTDDVLLHFKGIGKHGKEKTYRELASIVTWCDVLTDSTKSVKDALILGKNYIYTELKQKPVYIKYIAFDSPNNLFYFQEIESGNVFYRDTYELSASEFEEFSSENH